MNETKEGKRYADFSILLVDDEPDVTDILNSYLIEYTDKIFTAPDGEKALDALKNQEINLAFIDLVMPGIHGLELIEIINRDYPETISIILTGNRNREAALRASKANIFDFMDKPFTKQNIMASAKAALNFISTRRKPAIKPDVSKHKKEIDVLMISNDEEAFKYKTIFFSFKSNSIFTPNLEEAKSYLGISQPDIVLIDLECEKDKKIKFIKDIKENEKTFFVHIMLITGKDETITANEIFGAGVDEHIIKPLKPVQFKTKIGSIINKINRHKAYVEGLKERIEKDNKLLYKVLRDNKSLENELNNVSSKNRTVSQNELEINELREDRNNFHEENKRLKDEIESMMKDINLQKEIIEHRRKEEVSIIPPDNETSKAIKEKDDTIKKLSEIISRRSKSNTLREKERINSLKKADEIKKLKTDGKKEDLEKQKSGIKDTYGEIKDAIMKALEHISEIISATENSDLSRDSLIERSLNSIIKFNKSLIQELTKYKKMYFEKTDNKQSFSMVKTQEEARVVEFNTITDNMLKELARAGDNALEVHSDAKSEIKRIEENVQKLMDDLNKRTDNYQKTEEEWLNMLQEHYKEKYFTVLDEFNDLKTAYEEKEITLNLLKKEKEKTENMLMYLREKERGLTSQIFLSKKAHRF